MSSSGVLVAVVGPSGAGKDTLIAHARSALAKDDGFVFVRRLVTRGSNAFEDHDTIDEATFERDMASDIFALAWRAHGLGYALPAATRELVDRGGVAICNLSRAVLPAARARFPEVRVVAVTAPEAVLAARLAARGRETLEAVAERLRREAEREDSVAADLTIVNDRPVAETGGVLLDFLRELRR